jgi:hypothetical protein
MAGIRVIQFPIRKPRRANSSINAVRGCVNLGNEMDDIIDETWRVGRRCVEGDDRAGVVTPKRRDGCGVSGRATA